MMPMVFMLVEAELPSIIEASPASMLTADAMFAGVFLDDNEPIVPDPANLVMSGIDFTSLVPILAQSFLLVMD